MSDLISRQDAIDAIDKWFDNHEEHHGDGAYDNGVKQGMFLGMSIIRNLPSAARKSDEESELKFYYVESIDDYWIGKRLDNFYYADWNDGLGFVWSHSRYLPWGKHIINENTLWKEHTYPSEPVEIPFTTWIAGFMKKHSAEPEQRWIPCSNKTPKKTGYYICTCHDGVCYRTSTLKWSTGWVLTGARSYWKVIAWMPLPEPYSGVDMRGEENE